ncbi:MAG: sulfurtransferase TusA family protein [Nitrososphaerales archaeon]|nr:sulfurtransferase TusA family protein [Nitrososphaerales archaeon]
MKIGDCEYPDALLYDAEAGTWAKEERGRFRLGLAPHLSWISGGFTSISFKSAGSRVGAGKSLGSVEGPRHFDVIRSPFDCIISEVNKKLLTNPRLANKDPFGAGWFIVVERFGGPSRLKDLAGAADSIYVIVRQLGVHCFAEFPDAEMFEIGVECSAVLVRLNEQLERSSSGTVVHIVSDDPTSDVEMARWQDQTGNAVLESRREGGLHHFIVKKS